MTDEQEPTPTPAPTPAPKKAAKKKPTKDDKEFNASSYRIMASEKVVGSLYDQDRKVRIGRAHDVEVAGPIKPGSWLYCQIKAGLIKFM